MSVHSAIIPVVLGLTSPVTVSVGKAGTGSGSVASNPAGSPAGRAARINSARGCSSPLPPRRRGLNVRRLGHRALQRHDLHVQPDRGRRRRHDLQRGNTATDAYPRADAHAESDLQVDAAAPSDGQAIAGRFNPAPTASATSAQTSGSPGSSGSSASETTGAGGSPSATPAPSELAIAPTSGADLTPIAIAIIIAPIILAGGRVFGLRRREPRA